MSKDYSYLFPDGKDSEHLQWLHDRIVNVYGESENVDFLHKFRKIIKTIQDNENNFQKYFELKDKMKEKNVEN
jgi:hypothetical protein